MGQTKRVLVIYTGGTFGMLKNEKGGKRTLEFVTVFSLDFLFIISTQIKVSKEKSS